MPIRDRDWYRDEHPPTCSCVSCTEKRLEAQKYAATEENLTRWEHSWRYQQWKIEKRVSEKEAKAEWMKWVKEQGWILKGKSPLPTPMPRITYHEPKPKPTGIPKLLWVILAVAIIFFISTLAFKLYPDVSIAVWTPSSNPPPQTESIVPPNTSQITPIPPEVIVPPPTEITPIAPVEPTTPETQSGRVWIDSYTYIVGGDWEPIILTDNPTATNPTSTHLFTFLEQDQTDKHPYSSFYVCADFAETLHNNAEVAGIRAAFVVLDGVDHSLNAFETIDKGIIFIDCTGEEDWIIHSVTLPWEIPFGETTSWDKIAYIQEGKPLGFISLEVAPLYGYHYSSYKKWQEDVALFDAKLDAYNKQIGDRIYVSEEEYNQLMIQLAELEELASHLGSFWEEIGIVTNYNIIWEGT